MSDTCEHDHLDSDGYCYEHCIHSQDREYIRVVGVSAHPENKHRYGSDYAEHDTYYQQAAVLFRILRTAFLGHAAYTVSRIYIEVLKILILFPTHSCHEEYPYRCSDHHEHYHGASHFGDRFVHRYFFCLSETA